MAASSPTNAFAVGRGTGSLIDHWNGRAWKLQASQHVGADAELLGVATTSSVNAWAVGTYYSGTMYRTLIEHWNGKAWRVQPSPAPMNPVFPTTSLSGLNGVAATSSSNAWAVGHYWTGATIAQTLIAHWNGKAWQLQLSPNPGGSSTDSLLSGVAATSSSNAWAVGYNGAQVLIEHWNGQTWTPQTTPILSGGGKVLTGVAATSSRNAWAVGYHGFQTLIEHWNGKAWKVQSSPTLSGNANVLAGVAAISSTNAWAVGHHGARTLIEHWNGTTWKLHA